MPRLSRKISRTGVYHVMLRGINRNPIFADEDDCRKFLKILRQLISPKNSDNKPLPPYCHIHAYCLMINHIHLLIEEGEEPISSTMKRIGIAYVSYFNKRHNRLGPLFHDRFRSEPVTDAGYFITLLRYIHCNPVEAGIVDSPNKYQWSSWHEYDGSIQTDCICSHQFPFSRMSWEDICELTLNVSNVQRPQSDISKRRLSDTEAAEILSSIYRNQPIKQLPRKERRYAIIAAIKAGISMRQLARIEKIDYKTIARIVAELKNKE